MGKFEDFIRTIPTDIQLPDNFLSELQGAYNQDIAEKDNEISVRDAKIEDVNTKVSELTGSITDLKLKNYDLLMAVPRSDSQDSNDSQSRSSDEDNVSGVDSLFKKDE